MKNLLALSLILLIVSTSSAQDATSNEASDNIQYEYATFYFTESSRWNVMVITHPDGSTESESHRFKFKESPRFGNYSWMMPRLNKLLSEGYRVKSHSVSVDDEESGESHVHIYLLERPVPTESATSILEQK